MTHKATLSPVLNSLNLLSWSRDFLTINFTFEVLFWSFSENFTWDISQNYDYDTSINWAILKTSVVKHSLHVNSVFISTNSTYT